MAMKKKDEDPKKKKAVAKKPATFGGANSKLMPPKPKAQSSVMVKPPPPVGKYAGGLPNSNFKSPSRTTVAVGPATFPVSKRTEKSTGGLNMSNNKENPIVEKKKSSNTKTSGAKAGGSNSSGWQTATQLQQTALDQKAAGKRSGKLGLTLLGVVGGAGVAMSLRKNKEKRQAKRAARKESRAERKSGVMVVEKGTKTKTK
jgi:hypothetical protein